MAEPSLSGEGREAANAFRSDPRGFRLTKEDRIRRPSEYRRIMEDGVRYRTPHFIIRMLKNSLGRRRLGISASRKAGNACARNRIKRRLREYFRLNREKMPPETDMVFITRSGAVALDTRRLAEELDRFFQKEL